MFVLDSSNSTSERVWHQNVTTRGTWAIYQSCIITIGLYVACGGLVGRREFGIPKVLTLDSGSTSNPVLHGVVTHYRASLSPFHGDSY
jgi:hypothetical protein